MASAVPVTFTLPRDLIERLDAAAAADDRSRSATARRILRHALAEDAALREVAAARFAELNNSRPALSLGSGTQPPAAPDPSALSSGGRFFFEENSMPESEQQKLAAERQAQGRRIAEAAVKAAGDPHPRPVPHEPVADRPAARPTTPAETWRAGR